MVISTGTIRPSLACACVCALNSLQKPMMLTPCWPRAGPTGGEGFALPAGSCSLTIPVTFFISLSHPSFDFRGASGFAGPPLRRRLPPFSCSFRLLHLHGLQFEPRGAAADRHPHPHPAPFRGHVRSGC